MTDHTPTTAEVRFRYTEFPYVSQIEDEPGDPAEFNRWLAKHDAELTTKASAKIQSAYDRGYKDADRDWRQAGDGKGLT